MSNIPTYDAGLLSYYGGGDVAWWQDYIRAELGRAHEFYASLLIPEVTADAIIGQRIAGLREARGIAQMFSINETPIHPDIPWAKMTDQAKMIAHTTCQCVAFAIADRIDVISEGREL